MDNHREVLNCMWHIMTDGLDYSDTGKYDKWLEKKGYSPRTIHLYDLMMRRVEHENLTRFNPCFSGSASATAQNFLSIA